MRKMFQTLPRQRGSRPPLPKRQRCSSERQGQHSRQETKQEARKLAHHRWRVTKNTVCMPIDVNSFKHRVDNFRAGAISRCYKKWKTITKDPWILKLVKGYNIEFKWDPYQDFRPEPLRLNNASQTLLDSALAEFLELGIVEPCDYNEYGFYSTLFPIAKKDKSARIIFNLSDLNWFIDAEHFKMDTIKGASHIITFLPDTNIVRK